ncbi:MAG: diacylglycerol/lipid kinase family protein [Acidimicrobiales bacterium]
MRVLLVVNSTASAVNSHTCEQVEQALRDHFEVTVATTAAREHACALARQAVADGLDAVVALGGDGTVNEVANGLVGSTTALGALPGGSTNVFARTIGLPNRPIPAARRLAAALEAGSRRRVGVGAVGERYFLFNLGMGFDAAVVELVERRADLKRWLGHGLFAAAAVRTWAGGYDRVKPHFTVHLPDGEAIDHGYFAVCLKTDPYTFLGPRPFHLVPGTGFDTALSLVVLRDLSASTLVGAALSALAGRGNLEDRDGVEVRTGLEHLTVEGHRPFPHQVDGDYLGTAERLELAHRPDCLHVLLPLPE